MKALRLPTPHLGRFWFATGFRAALRGSCSPKRSRGVEEPPEPGPFGPPEARFRLASAWTGWDLTGSQAIHPVPLPCSKTPAESVVPHQSGPTDAAPAPNTTKASAVT